MPFSKEIIKCFECHNEFEVETSLFVDLVNESDKSTINNLLDGKWNVFRCPRCERTAFYDHPLTILDSAGHIVFHYLPLRICSNLPLEMLFESNGIPKRKLLEGILSTAKSRNIDLPALSACLHGTVSCRIRIFHSLQELISNIIMIKKIAECRQAKKDYYRDIKAPEGFLRRGASLYKKKKLETVYRLIHAFDYGCVYSENEVDRTVFREMEFIKGSLPQADHVRVAFVELGLMQRTPDGRNYWREPDISMTCGIYFPVKIGSFQKQGFKIFEDPSLGFSVEYRHGRFNDICANFYIYDKGLKPSFSADLEREYGNARKEIFDLYEKPNFHLETISDQMVEIENSPACSPYYQLSARIMVESAHASYMSYLLMTISRGRFIKLRLTFPESGEFEKGILDGFVSELFSLATAPHMLKKDVCVNGEPVCPHSVSVCQFEDENQSEPA